MIAKSSAPNFLILFFFELKEWKKNKHTKMCYIFFSFNGTPRRWEKIYLYRFISNYVYDPILLMVKAYYTSQHVTIQVFLKRNTNKAHSIRRRRFLFID